MKVVAILALAFLLAGSDARNLKKAPRSQIVGGEEVEPHSIPFQVSFQLFGFHNCGGAVMEPNVILTAAHCCEGYNVNSLSIVAGEHSLSQDEGTEQRINVQELIMHEDFRNPETYSNDICLLILESDLVYNDVVQPVAMPTQGQQFEGSGEVSGWGDLVSGGTGPDTLYAVTVPLVDDQICYDLYEVNPIGPTVDMPNMICAGDLENGGIDSCQGDSGGPFTCNGAERVHCGIVSWGEYCAYAEYPGVYAETSYFIDWIAEQLA